MIEYISLLSRRHRVLVAMVSGALATATNMAMLAALSATGIRTSHGGLLRLLVLGFTRGISLLGISATCREKALFLVTAGWFQSAFHILAGLLMAVIYMLLLEPRRGASPLLRGILYGIAIWLVNSLVVLPAIGEGVAGKKHLNALGICSFATAHLSYFLVLSSSTYCLRREEPMGRHSLTLRR